MRLRAGATRICLVALAFCLALSGCGIPEDSSPRALEEPVQPTAAPPTPTPPPAQTRTATIFLLDANSRVAKVERELVERRIVNLIEELIRDPSDEEKERSLTTAVPSGVALATDPNVTDGLAVLDLAPGGLEILEGTELTQALAQIVWTMTNLETIERVEIRIGGEPKTWITPDEGEQTNLRQRHFESFDPEYVEPPTPTPEPTPTATPG